MKWTTEKVEELRRRYPHEDNARLARDFGCSRKALVFRASSLGLRKTDAAHEARYAAMSKRPAPEGYTGERREIATGTVIVRGNVLIHLSNYSASREQSRPGAEENAAKEHATAEGGASLPLARRLAAQLPGAHRHTPCGCKRGQGGLGQQEKPNPPPSPFYKGGSRCPFPACGETEAVQPASLDR